MRIPLSWRLASWFGLRSFQLVDGDRIYVARLEACWQVHVLPPSANDGLRTLIDEEREGATDSLAESIEDPLWEVLTSGWVTVDPGDFAAIVAKLEDAQDELKICLLARPAEAAGPATGLVDFSVLSVLAEHVPIPGIDKSFSEIRQYLEIAGIVLVALSGGHILACASFKLLAHDQLGKLLSKALERFLHEVFTTGKASDELALANTNSRYPDPGSIGRHHEPGATIMSPDPRPRSGASIGTPDLDPPPPSGGLAPLPPFAATDVSRRPEAVIEAGATHPGALSPASIWLQCWRPRPSAQREPAPAEGPRADQVTAENPAELTEADVRDRHAAIDAEPGPNTIHSRELATVNSAECSEPVAQVRHDLESVSLGSGNSAEALRPTLPTVSALREDRETGILSNQTRLTSDLLANLRDSLDAGSPTDAAPALRSPAACQPDLSAVDSGSGALGSAF
jgi:hypothetical protein